MIAMQEEQARAEARAEAHRLQAEFDATVGDAGPALKSDTAGGLRGLRRGVQMPPGQRVERVIAALVAAHYEMSQAREGYEIYPDVPLGVVTKDDDGELILYSAHGHVLSRYRLKRRERMTIGDAERENPWSALEEL